MEKGKYLEAAELRASLLGKIRSFFDDRRYLEVDTPILSPTRIPEAPIEVFTTAFASPFASELPLALIPSPEIWMKRLLAEGFPSCYQITKSFRNAEQLGRYHNPEFTILEWYTLGADYMDSIDITRELLKAAAQEVPDPEGRPLILSMEDAFSEFAGIDLRSCGDMPGLKEAARKAGIDAGHETWEELFNRIFLSRVEPEFRNIPVLFLYDYPAQIPCLAKLRDGEPYRERWELYINGVEIANCFTEQRDPEKVSAFVEEEAAASARRETPAGSGLEVPADRALPGISSRMPPCSGVALGVDRLLMALTGAGHIRDVLLFPFEDFRNILSDQSP